MELDYLLDEMMDEFLFEYSGKLEELDKCINKEEDGYLVLKKMQLMKQLNYDPQEIEDLLDEYYEKSEVRAYLIDHFLDLNQQLDAIAVLEDSIILDKDTYRYQSYQLRLLELYLNNQMMDLWKELAYKYVLSYHDINVYKQFKKYDNDLDKRITIYHNLNNNELDKFYFEDLQLDKLFELIKDDNNLKRIDLYEDVLKEKYSFELSDIYYKHVLLMIENDDKQVDFYIKKIMSYPGGEKLTNSLNKIKMI